MGRRSVFRFGDCSHHHEQLRDVQARGKPSAGIDESGTGVNTASRHRAGREYCHATAGNAANQSERPQPSAARNSARGDASANNAGRRSVGGNTVRTVTACAMSGVCRDEQFDVTPYAHAITYFLLGHDDTQDFGRKFKVAFSGCKDEPCGLTNFHDAGAIAKTRVVNGEVKRGFEYYVGGGLGAVPYPATLFD